MLGAGVVRAANGPFPPGNIGYNPLRKPPAFDLAKAKALVDAYESAVGPIKIKLQVTPNDAVRGQLAKAMWEKAGMEVELSTKEPQLQIVDLLTGKYMIAPGQLPGAPDPDTQNIWWQSGNVQPIGKLSLNYGRITDTVIDNALKTLRENADPKARKAAALAIGKRFTAQQYALWTYWVVWALAYSPKVQDPATITLPNGDQSAPYREGTNWLVETYLTK